MKRFSKFVKMELSTETYDLAPEEDWGSCRCENAIVEAIWTELTLVENCGTRLDYNFASTSIVFDSDTAKEIMGNLALDPGTTLANEHLAKHALATVAE